MKIELTKSQCKNLSEFIEMRLIDEIREDDGIDNFDWLRDMVNAKEALDNAVAEYEHYERIQKSVFDGISATVATYCAGTSCENPKLREE